MEIDTEYFKDCFKEKKPLIYRLAHKYSEYRGIITRNDMCFVQSGYISDEHIKHELYLVLSTYEGTANIANNLSKLLKGIKEITYAEGGE